MHFASVLAVSVSLLAVGYAAEPLAFTSFPDDIQAGKPVTLTWEGAADNEPVTLTLRKGNAGDLQDVETITDQAEDGRFTWTPGDNIEEGTDYAFQISQNGQSNYSGLLKAGPKVDSPVETTQTGTTATSASTTDSTSATEATATGTTSTGTTSKPLISSSASGTPSSSPASTSVVSSTVTAKGPFMTNTDVVNGKGASATGGMQSGVASGPNYSLELVAGAIGLLVYLVQ